MHNRVALITGATSAIGAAAARGFAKAGYSVALVSRRGALLEALAQEIVAAGGRALALAADVTDAAAIANVVERTVARFGGLDAAFNNAGAGARPTPLAEITPETFSQVLSVNATGTFLSMHSEIRAMLSGRGGTIVNMSSTAGLQGVAGLSPYCAAKFAVIGMSKATALDYADRNIRVNVAAPGPIATERIDAEQRARIGQFVPMRRIGTPEEVASLVLWLCSPESAFITGEVIAIDGGRLAGTPSFAISSS
jgi:NAD(P)-dependent dehydrogenase (short-subunit alcohol dehydrogenase family)